MSKLFNYYICCTNIVFLRRTLNNKEVLLKYIYKAEKDTKQMVHYFVLSLSLLFTITIITQVKGPFAMKRTKKCVGFT